MENVLFTPELFGCTYTGSKGRSAGMLFNNITGCVGDDEMLIIRGDINIGSSMLLGSGQRKKHAVYLKANVKWSLHRGSYMSAHVLLN